MCKNLFTLYQYIKNKYDNYQDIKYSETEIIIVFYDELEMRISEQKYFNLYFNNIFYYNVDWQDIKDTLDDFFSNKCVICLKKNRIKIFYLSDYKANNDFTHVWTISEKLK